MNRRRRIAEATAMGLLGAGCITVGVVALQTPSEAPVRLAPAFSCLYVPDADTASLSVREGHSIEYSGSTDEWSVDGTVVGWAPAEDSSFDACGDPALIDLLKLEER